jgi:hypothetical protein
MNHPGLVWVVKVGVRIDPTTSIANGSRAKGYSHALAQKYSFDPF